MIKLTGEPVQLSELPTHEESPAHAKTRIDELQLTLLRLQQGLALGKQRAIILLEGTDTAGKGGIIRRMVRHLDPRSMRVWPIGAPTAAEQGRHYLYRFWQRLPQPGEIAIFDRSWYGRVLVERVEGFIEEPVWERAYRELHEFERQLTDDGIILIKLFLHISKAEQTDRFLARAKEPTKRWKITAADLDSRAYWAQYQQAYEAMLQRCSSYHAPWHVIPADNKSAARVRAMEIVEQILAERIDVTRVRLLQPDIRARIQQEFGIDPLADDKH